MIIQFQNISKVMHTKHTCWNKSVVENAFGVLNKKILKLFLKTNLDILFMLDVNDLFLHLWEHDFRCEVIRC